MATILDDYCKKLMYGQFDFKEEEYRKLKALNYSSIKNGKKGPVYVDRALEGLYRKDTKHFKFGRIYHCYVYEPEIFDNLYFFSDFHMDGRTARGKDGKAKLDYEDIMKGRGRLRIDLDDGEKIKRMRDSLFAHPVVKKILEIPGKTETTIVWENKEFGVNIKSRYDYLPRCDFIVDLKSTKDCTEAYFPYDFRKYAYDIQSSLYVDGFKNIFKEDREYITIAQEKEEPYDVEYYVVSEKTLEIGREKYRRYIEEWIEYKKDPASIYKIKYI